MGRKAFSYIRFSSPKQADGDSLRRQREMRDEYIQRKGLELDESMNLLDLGISAWTGDNAATGALSVFLDLCRKGEIPKGSVLIVEHLDRLTRQQVRPALTLFFQILDAGVTIVTLTPEREYTPESSEDPLSLIEPLFLFANVNEKSETLSKRLRDTWSEKRKQRKPLTSWTPAWIKLKDDRTGFVLIEDRAEIVRQIVRLALSGYGDIRLVRKLNDDKVPVISGHEHWTNAYVSKILKSPALIGYYEPGMDDKDGRRVLTGEVWTDYFPAVITQEEYYQLRAARQSRTSQRGPSGTEVANLFTGLLHNARDGQPYQRIVKNHARLISASFRNGLSDGDTQSFPYEPLENAFLYGFAGQLKLQDLYGGESPIPSDDMLTTLLGELADVDTRIAVVKQRIQTDSGITAFLDVLADLDRKRKDLVEKIEEERTRQVQIGKEATVLSDLQALAKLWAGEHPDRSDIRTRIKAKIRQLISEIWMVVYGRKRSKFKSAQLQIFFRGGGSKMLVVHAITDKYRGAELVENSGSGNAVLPASDLRLLHDPVAGVEVAKYVDLMEKICEHDTALAKAKTDGEGQTDDPKV
jgi:DNA invertase Pin-like site-specific DNA recombinase